MTRRCRWAGWCLASTSNDRQRLGRTVPLPGLDTPRRPRPGRTTSTGFGRVTYRLAHTCRAHAGFRCVLRRTRHQRRARGLGWYELADELWQQSSELNARLGDHPLCGGAVSRCKRGEQRHVSMRSSCCAGSASRPRTS
jgi:hypothetical protein